MAALNNVLPAISNRLKNGDAIDAQDEDGFTALMFAAKRGNLEAVNLLVEKGANCQLKNNAGLTAFELAVAAGHVVISKKIELTTLEVLNIEVLSNEVEDFDLSNWVEEDEEVLPSHNIEIESTSKLISKLISKHQPIDKDSNWEDVEIDLPDIDIDKKYPRGIFDVEKVRLDNDCENCLFWGLSYGSIPVEWINKIFEGFDDSDFLQRSFANVLNDLGIYLNDNNYFSNQLIPSQIPYCENDEALVNQALNYFQDLIRDDSSPSKMYMRELAQFNLLTSSEEIEIAKEIEAGITGVTNALANCPVIIATILDLALAVDLGTLPIDGFVDAINDLDVFDSEMIQVLEEQSGLVDILDEDSEEDGNESFKLDTKTRSQKLEELKQRSLEKFAIIRSQFEKMKGAYEREGYNSVNYTKAKTLIQNELVGFRFSVKTIERLCDTVRIQVNQIWSTERSILNIMVDKVGISRSEVIAQLPKNTLNLQWTDTLLKEGKPYSALLKRNIPTIQEFQKKLIDLQNKVVIPLPELKEVHKKMTAGERRTRKAKHELTVANLRLVISIAKKYSYFNIEFSDLIQEGNIGLIKAVDKFEYRRGFKFSTYATWWIRQAVSRFVQDQSREIRVPVHMGDLINKIAQIERALINIPIVEVDKVIAKKLGLTEEKIKNTKEKIYSMVSLQSEDKKDIETLTQTEFDVLDLSSDFENFSLRESLEKIFKEIPRKEVQVIKYRFGWYGEEFTLEKIAEQFGLTRERIRQIEAKGIRRLSNSAKLRKLGFERKKNPEKVINKSEEFKLVENVYE